MANIKGYNDAFNKVRKEALPEGTTFNKAEMKEKG